MDTISLTPVTQNQRVVIVDVLRGWALLGVVLMNYNDVFWYLGAKPNPDAFNMGVISVLNFIFSAKSWTMLSVLFGYGFAVLINNIAKKGINPVKFFSRRMFWLLVIALINSAIFFGDILKDYAVMGMILLLFRNVSAKTAFYIALSLFLINPFLTAYVISLKINGFALAAPYFPLYQSHNLLDVFKSGLMGTYEFEMLNPFYSVVCHEVILLCFFVGLAAKKINFFDRLAENKKYVKRTFWSTLSFSVMMFPLLFLLHKMKLDKYFQPFFWLTLSMMIFTMSALCWLYMAGKLKGFFAAMQVFGRMTLTNYITQNILAVIIFSGVGFRLGAIGLSYSVYMLIALAIYVVQIFFSKWWLSKCYYGPVEWVWRQLSYGKRLEIRRR